MTSFDVTPLVGIGPVSLGMDRQRVRQVMGGPFSSFGKTQADAPLTDAFLESAFQVFYDGADRAEFIELSRGGPFAAIYKGVSVFETSAEELVTIVSQDADLDRNRPEQGYSFIFPRLELSLWRQSLPGTEDDADEEVYEDDEEPGAYFDTVAVGRPGYFSLGDA